MDNIYKGRKKLSTVDSHTIHYGHIVDEIGEPLDEVMVTVMKGPRTFTREDVVEVNSHGGNRYGSTCVGTNSFSRGKVSRPGEFTKGAFLNGRIDLSRPKRLLI